MSSDTKPALRPEAIKELLWLRGQVGGTAGCKFVIDQAVAELERLAAENAALKAELAALRSQLSRIDYAFGEPNEMQCSPYDVDLDGERVVRQVEAILKPLPEPPTEGK